LEGVKKRKNLRGKKGAKPPKIKVALGLIPRIKEGIIPKNSLRN